MLLMKVVLLIWYSNKNFGFRKIESYLASKIDFEIWKCPIFASSASNCLTRYEQILSGCSLGCKNALNFTCLPMKFHNRVHTSVQPIQNLWDEKLFNLPPSFCIEPCHFSKKVMRKKARKYIMHGFYKQNTPFKI